jgi:hypothetical protein
MPRDKDRKRIIRSRMRKTGESYTAARAHVIPTPKTTQPPARSVDHAALAGMSNEKIAEKTGRTWRQWVRVLDADDAAAMSHRDIAMLVHGKHRVADWWAQTVTVGYERIKGLRERGQRRGGSYETTKSKTYSVPVKVLFDAWSDDGVRRQWLEGVNATVRTATSPKSMRLLWPDGTVVIVGFTSKGPSKSMVALAHTKLPDRDASEKAKKHWTARLDALASLFASSLT